MPIEGGLRGKLAPGTRLAAKYKGVEYSATVVEAKSGGIRYRFDDGQEFGSLSAAGTAVMGGIACNGWRFWSVAESAPKRKPAAKRSTTKRAAR